MFSLREDEIDVRVESTSFADPAAGAFVSFEGWVREHNEGKKVLSLEYETHRELAQKEGEKILNEAQAEFSVRKIACIHRYGHLKISDCAVWVAASAHHRDDAFKACRYVIDEVKKRLPIWKKEYYVDAPAAWVSCQEHHLHFTEGDYYAKQGKIVAQEKLKKSRVIVIGAGGLGCAALQSLAIAGVGQLTIIDFDRVEISNLHRQPLYSKADIGKSKVSVAQKNLSKLNSFISVTGLKQRITFANALKILDGYDLVLDCTDLVATKCLLHDACFALGIPLISAGIYKNEGQLRTYAPMQGCLHCFTTKAVDTFVGNCNDFGVLGVTTAIFGNLQASEALQYLQVGTNASLRATFYLDLTSLNLLQVKNKKDEKCRFCSKPILFTISQEEQLDCEITIDELSAHAKSDYEFVDIRDKATDFLQQYVNSPKKVIVFCQRGIRSREIVQQYRERGCLHFYSLSGGACTLLQGTF